MSAPRTIPWARLEADFLAKKNVAPAAVIEAISSAVLGVEWSDVLRAFSLELHRTGDPKAAIRSAAIQATYGKTARPDALGFIEQAAQCERVPVGHILGRRADRATSRARMLAMLLMSRAGMNQEEIGAALDREQPTVAAGLQRIEMAMQKDPMFGARVRVLLDRPADVRRTA